MIIYVINTTPGKGNHSCSMRILLLGEQGRSQFHMIICLQYGDMGQQSLLFY